MKMKGRAILLASSLGLIVSTAIPGVQAFAASIPAASGVNTAAQNVQNEKTLAIHQQIIKLLNNMQQQRAIALLDTKEGVATPSGLPSRILTDQAQLAGLGVSQLTSPQVHSILDNGTNTDAGAHPLTPERIASIIGEHPNVSVPSNTSDVEWYSTTYTWSYDGKNYNVQELYAQGLNGNSDLSAGASGVNMYTNAQLDVNTVENLAEELAEYSSSFIPIVQWAPTSLLPGITISDKVINESETVSYASLETMCYAYVWPVGYPESDQKLSFTSNWEDIADTQVLVGYNDGSPYTKSTNQTENISAPYFADANSEVDGYVNGPSDASTESWVEAFQFANWNDTAHVTAYVDTNSLPGTVY